MPYMEEDERRMGEIADAHLGDLIDKLIVQLRDGEYVVQLFNGNYDGVDQVFDEYLNELIERLDFLLDAAKSRQVRLRSARGEKVEANG